MQGNKKASKAINDEGYGTWGHSGVCRVLKMSKTRRRGSAQVHYVGIIDDD